MPVSIAALHRNYGAVLAQEGLGPYLQGLPCPRFPGKCSGAGSLSPLVPTRTTVLRVVVFLAEDAYGILTVVRGEEEVALARCKLCKGRFRVLPCDLLPWKHYTLSVIELLVVAYNRGVLSLRAVAWSVHGEGPAHTTLHAWTEGLGAYTLGRPTGEIEPCLPASRVVKEAESRYPQLEVARTAPVRVNPDRYRSEPRRERLAACIRLLAVSTLLVRAARSDLKHEWETLAELGRLVLHWCSSFPFRFRTGFGVTSSEHMDSGPRGHSSLVHRQPMEEHPCETLSKSPRGATSRSPP